MSSWGREVLSRLFPSKSRSRATSDTTTNKTRITNAAAKEDDRFTRRSSLSTVTTFLRNGTRSGANDVAKSTISHRRNGSHPLSGPPKIARLCHTRSQTQVNPMSRLPNGVHFPVELDDELDDEQGPERLPAAAEHVQDATRHALKEADDASFVAHDPTINWEPPAWEDLWRDPARNLRRCSSSFLSAFAGTPKKIIDNSDSRARSRRCNRSVSRKSSFGDLRSSAQLRHGSMSSGNAFQGINEEASTASQQKSNLQKRLPHLPPNIPSDPAHLPPRYLQENTARNAAILKSLQDDGVLQLGNVEETHTAVICSPAVTHERRVIQPIEIVQRAVAQNVHNHHVVHRVLPILDMQVLPARHFMPDGRGGYLEISEDGIPGGKPDGLDELIAGATSGGQSEREGGMSAPKLWNQFREDQGCPKEHASQEEQWWLHSPYTTASALPHSSKPEYANTAPQTSRLGQQIVPDHAAAKQKSFQYRTSDGLPSWTAITTETQPQLPPAAYAPRAASVLEKLATSQKR